MTNPTQPGNEGSERERPQGDRIAWLLRVAGPRVSAPRERESRVRETLYAEWTELLRARRLKRFLGWSGVAVAAVAATLLLTVTPVLQWSSLSTTAAPSRTVATLESVTGAARSAPAGEQIAATSPRLRIGDVLMSGAAVQTGDRDRAALRLDGGHSLRLDFNTRLRLISRDVLALEQGAVYVDSGPQSDAEATLAIQTGLGTVYDVGTQFEVRLSGQEIRIRVREGIVNLDRDGSQYEAHAGNEMKIDAEGILLRRVIPAYGPAWSWILSVAPPFELEGRSLAEFLEWAERETGWKMEFSQASSAEAASSVILHGDIHDLAPDRAVDAVLPTCGLESRLEGGTLQIDGRPRRES